VTYLNSRRGPVGAVVYVGAVVDVGAVVEVGAVVDVGKADVNFIT